jgi:radical SAM superfamily enzyme YgiQ (UPF0313 family)
MTNKPLVVLCQTTIGLLDQVKNKPGIPLSLITAACNLPAEGFDVVILDQRVTPRFWERLQAQLEREPVLVGVTAMLGEQIKYSLQVAKYVKEHSDVPVVWGGSQAGVMPDVTVKHRYVDYVIQGDAEESLPKLARCLSNDDYNGAVLVPGVWVKHHTTGVPVNLVPRQPVDLNRQNEPLYDHYGKTITQYMPDRFGYPTVDIEASRGCPYKCAFCYQEFLNGRWKPLDYHRVIERVLSLYRMGAGSFWFVDDEFFIDLDRSQRIVEFMAAHYLPWSIQGVTVRSVVKMDDAYLRMLKMAGCKQLNVGVESGSPKMLRLINKPITPDEVLAVNLRLKQVGIVPSYYFVVGFPDETKEDFDMTIDLAWRLLRENPSAKIMNVGTFSPYPNSGLEKRCIELGYEPPGELEDYIDFGVDRENLPWQKGNRDIIGAGFTNYFIDHKVDDLEVAWWMKLGAKCYRPVAQWRFRNRQFGFPVDIKMGRWLKEVVRS